jgi:hypothetical protein
LTPTSAALEPKVDSAIFLLQGRTKYPILRGGCTKGKDLELSPTLTVVMVDAATWIECLRDTLNVDAWTVMDKNAWTAPVISRKLGLSLVLLAL